ncbi:IclR family transcriptional regulator [Paracoccus sp. TK19116]|uniref:IclR family transcriptional regulator n=1 Tax=Paracoccus albicereus TaxID=2922394 RepID=A0ABT1MS43_9RHOB|nr:IclR family transcriptional regulator [Paracoccus albicereus]MCQ0971110.1 IclR family transcriptional regulator [Paracoccus albicereus]
MSEDRSTLARTLAILELFDETRLEWTPEQMIETLGYSRPTLYRYLKTLREAGLLTSLPGAGFTLGPKVVEMDFLLRKSDPITLGAQPHLDHLAETYPCTALLTRWYGGRILCVASECRTTSASSYPRGRPMPLARGAISRAIMAWLPRRQALPLIEANMSDLTEIGLGTTREDIQKSLREIRRSGVAVARGEVTRGVVGIAAPIFDSAQAPIAVICATTPSELLNDTAEAALCDDIRDAATRITSALQDRRAGTDAAPSSAETAETH